MAQELVIKIIGDTKSIEKAFRDTEKGGKRFGGAMKVGMAGAAAGFAGLAVAAKLGISEFLDAQKVTAQTNAVLKSTGGVANVSAKQIGTLSNALMRKSGVDDEAIQSGQNMLLTFTKIRNETGKGNDVFNQATKATLNLSVAMGKDMQSSALLLGKALNDPVKGMASLGRAGVQFTQEQKDTIKGLVEGATAARALSTVIDDKLTPAQYKSALQMEKSGMGIEEIANKLNVKFTPAQLKAAQELQKGGETMKAQKIILKELETQFGGSAEAAGKTFAGQMNIAKETALNFAGDVVAKVVPALAEVVAFIRENWPKIRQIIEDVTRDIRAIWEQWGDEIMAVVNFVFPIVQAAVENTLNIIQGFIDVFVGVLTGDWRRAWDGVKGIVTGVLDNIELALKSALTLLGKAAKALGTKIKDEIVEGVKGLPAAVWELTKGIGTLYVEMYSTVLGWGAAVAKAIVKGILDGLLGIGTAAWNVINNIGSVINDVAKTISGWGADVARYLINGLLDGLEGLGRKIIEKISDAFDWVRDHMPKAPGIGIDLNPFNGDPRNPNMTMPPGTAVGGGLMGASPVMAPFASLGKSLGLHVTSGFRPGAITANGTPSDHGIGKALDMADGADAMARFFMALLGNPAVKQAFYDPLGSIFGGRWSSYREGGHSDHVHVATYDQGGILRPGYTLAYNGTGRNEYVSRRGDSKPIVMQVVLDGRVIAETVRNQNALYQQRGGTGAFTPA